MTDEALRALERAATTDATARATWRAALVRSGRAAEAGVEVGDVVLVREDYLKWCDEPWLAVVRAVTENGWRVWPVDGASVPWATGHRPYLELSKEGMTMSRTMGDRLELVSPGGGA